jgi:hypothetical protein
MAYQLTTCPEFCLTENVPSPKKLCVFEDTTHFCVNRYSELRRAQPLGNQEKLLLKMTEKSKSVADEPESIQASPCVPALLPNPISKDLSFSRQLVT